MAKKKFSMASFMDSASKGMKSAGIDSNFGTIVDYYNNMRYIDVCDPVKTRPAIAMEWLFGARGIPEGKVVQLNGGFSTSKSSFLFWVYACAQLGGTVDDIKAWITHIETEGAPNPPEYIARFGIDPRLFKYSPVNSLDDLFNVICETDMDLHGGSGGTINPETGRRIKSRFTLENAKDPEMELPTIIGIDSLSNVGSDAGQDYVDINKSERPGGDSKDIRRFFRAKEQEFDNHRLTILAATHMTTKIESGGYGGPKHTARNQDALGMALTIAIEMSKNYQWKGGKEGKDVLGTWQILRTFKNKLAPKERQVKLFRKDLGGFDMAETDIQFFLDPKASNCKTNPFLPGGFLCPDGAKHGIAKVRGGYSAPLLSDRVFRTADEFVDALYSDKDRLMKIREHLRIRGFGFDFETRYTVTDDDAETGSIAVPDDEDDEKREQKGSEDDDN